MFFFGISDVTLCSRGGKAKRRDSARCRRLGEGLGPGIVHDYSFFSHLRLIIPYEEVAPFRLGHLAYIDYLNVNRGQSA